MCFVSYSSYSENQFGWIVGRKNATSGKIKKKKEKKYVRLNRCCDHDGIVTVVIA